MNLGWMTRYAFIVCENIWDEVSYLIPLTEAQEDRERKRVARKWNVNIKDVVACRMGDGARLK